MTPKEQEFYSALQDVFVGAKVEGESGYINLMRIKSRYFQEKVFPKLQQDIEATLDKYPDFRNELFDRLYDFFHRYFSESGSIYFRRTRYPQSVYEQVYTDDKDVMLFWKTRMLYYVKTDRLFKSLEVELDDHTPSTSSGRRFFFDVSTLQHKQANEKRDLVYRFDRVRADGTIVFQVEYSSHGSKTKMLEILKALRGEDVDMGEDVLERAFRVFEKQSEVDYFINKDAEKFLKEQFDLWMYQYLFDGENVWLQRRIEQLQALKRIAFSVIDFIAQFEDELVRVWNKPKFVRDSHYVITLDRIATRNAELLTSLLAHKGMAAQVAEWRELGMVRQDFEPGDVWADDHAGEQLDDACQYLPLDTRYVPDLELEIVGLFDRLDEALDGWLIKSENYQALNTLRPRFREQVKYVYIDPPYNTNNDEFIYRDNYQHSSWLTMMSNRLRLSQSWLDNEGAIFVSIDDNEEVRLRLLMEQVFGENNFIANIAWEKRFTRNNNAKLFSTVKDYVLLFRRSEKLSVLREPRTEEADSIYSNPDNDPRGLWTSVSYVNPATKEQRPNLVYKIRNPVTGEEVGHPTNAWKYSYEQHLEHVEEERLYWGPEGEHTYPRLKRFLSEVGGLVPVDIWKYEETGTTDEASIALQNMFGQKAFDNPKPVRLIKRIGRMLYNEVTLERGIFLDFFAGSGTTAQAVMNLNREDGGRRKYILVEMAAYFDDVLLPRVKKVAFSDQWKDGVAQEGGQGMSHFVKYYKLEQYEDVLRKATYVEDAVPFDNPYQDPYQQYVFLRDLKMLHALEINHEANEVHVDLSRLYPDIDLAETLANLRGKWIARITPEYVEFEDGERIDLQDLDWELIKPLIWW